MTDTREDEEVVSSSVSRCLGRTNAVSPAFHPCNPIRPARTRSLRGRVRRTSLLVGGRTVRASLGGFSRDLGPLERWLQSSTKYPAERSEASERKSSHQPLPLRECGAPRPFHTHSQPRRSGRAHAQATRRVARRDALRRLERPGPLDASAARAALPRSPQRLARAVPVRGDSAQRESDQYPPVDCWTDR